MPLLMKDSSIYELYLARKEGPQVGCVPVFREGSQFSLSGEINRAASDYGSSGLRSPSDDYVRKAKPYLIGLALLSYFFGLAPL